MCHPRVPGLGRAIQEPPVFLEPKCPPLGQCGDLQTAQWVHTEVHPSVCSTSCHVVVLIRNVFVTLHIVSVYK